MTSLKAWYLGALGVVRYVPRDLAGPVDSHAHPEAVTETAEPAPAPAPSPSPALAVAEELSRKAPKTERAPAATAPAGEAPDSAPQAFRLGFWQPSRDLVVITDMPPGIRVSARQQEMLARLLRAIGQLDGELDAAELIDWPQSPTSPGDIAGATEFLGVFMQVKASLQPFRRVLLMGSLAARVVAARECSVGDRPQLPWRAEGIVTHSLHEMARDESLKRPTWEAIKDLAGSP